MMCETPDWKSLQYLMTHKIFGLVNIANKDFCFVDAINYLYQIMTILFKQRTLKTLSSSMIDCRPLYDSIFSVLEMVVDDALLKSETKVTTISCKGNKTITS